MSRRCCSLPDPRGALDHESFPLLPAPSGSRDCRDGEARTRRGLPGQGRNPGPPTGCPQARGRFSGALHPRRHASLRSTVSSFWKCSWNCPQVASGSISLPVRLGEKYANVRTPGPGPRQGQEITSLGKDVITCGSSGPQTPLWSKLSAARPDTG